MKSKILSCAFGLVFGLAACTESKDATSETKSTTNMPKVAAAETNKVSGGSTNEVAIMKTSDGDMVFEFWTDLTPKTVANFETLAKKGYYDNTAFHRIVKGFMVQGGDPNTRDTNASPQTFGQGGPGYTIPDEFHNRSHSRGVISMAHTGAPNSGGSQFFICLDEAATSQLNGKYAAFGKLIKGDDVLEKIANEPTTGPNAMGEMAIPVKRVTIESIKIVPADSIK